MKKNNVENKFTTYVNEGKLNINTIEDIMLEDLEYYFQNMIYIKEKIRLIK